MALVVFTGGARSGKSAAAQRLAQRRAVDGQRVVVAVFGREEGDPEFAERVMRHRADRPAEFATLEVSDSRAWLAEVDREALLVVDCLGTLLGRVLEEEWGSMGSGFLGEAPEEGLPSGFEAAVAQRGAAMVEAIAERCGDTIIVTNEVGDGVIPAFATGRVFRDVLGRCNRRLVEAADVSYLVVAGRLLPLDGLRTDAQWPED